MDVDVEVDVPNTFNHKLIAMTRAASSRRRRRDVYKVYLVKCSSKQRCCNSRKVRRRDRR